MLEWLQAGCLIAGTLFCLVGTLALLRFRDVYTRIHALTKVDNLGLGLIILGLLPDAGSLAVAAKMILVWLLVLMASATAAHLVARNASLRGEKVWPGPRGEH